MVNKETVADRDNLFIRFIPYGVTLLYIEIAIIMFLIALVVGKLPAVIFGFTLTGFLTWNILGIQQKKEINRLIQLYLMDIHVALSVVYFLNFLFTSIKLVEMDYYIIISRGLLCAFEIPAIYFLTRDDVKGKFK